MAAASQKRFAAWCLRIGGALLILTLAAVLVGVLGAEPAGEDHGKRRTASLAARVTLAIGVYECRTGRYPEPDAGVLSCENLCTELQRERLVDGLDGNIDDTDGNGRNEIVDAWGRPLNYFCERSPGGGDGTVFDVFSSGPDGKVGTEDDVWPFGDGPRTSLGGRGLWWTAGPAARASEEGGGSVD